jgi:hypothetical protein
MHKLKALAEKWHSEAVQQLKLSEATVDRIESLTKFGMAMMQDFCAEELDLAILAIENEAYMESICPGFRDLDDVVATAAAVSVQEQTRSLSSFCVEETKGQG